MKKKISVETQRKIVFKPWKIKTRFCVFSKQLRRENVHTAKGRSRSNGMEPQKANIASIAPCPSSMIATRN